MSDVIDIERPVYEEPVALPDLLEETGMELKSSIGFEEWNRLGQNLQRIGRSHQWWLGDWYHFGEDKFGEMAPQAIEMTGLEPKTLVNYARVAGRIPKRDRRPSLSWTHHRIVADLDSMADRRSILKQAEAESLSTRDVEKLVRAKMGKPEDDAPLEDHASKTTATFTLSFTLHKEDERHGLVILELLEGLRDRELEERGLEPTKRSSSNS